jgi:hypothetical protein
MPCTTICAGESLFYLNDQPPDTVSLLLLLHSMCSENAFEGAELNLKRIISCRLKDGSRNNPSHDPIRIVRTCIESFRQIICQILFSTSSSETSAAFTPSIDNFILTLNQAAKLTSVASVPSRPAFMDDAIWFKMGLVIVMTEMRVNRDDKRQLVFYLLRHFFVSLIRTITSQITYYCVHKQNPPAEKTSPTGSSSNSTESDDRKSRETTPETSPFRQTVRSRKRKRASRCAVRDDDSDCSELELEETAMRAIDALDISSDLSGDEISDATSSQSSQEGPDSQNFDLKTTQMVGLDGEMTGTEKSERSASLSGLQQVYQYSPIQTFKVFCDIFVSNPQLLESCAFEKSDWQSLIDLLNMCLAVEKEVTADPDWKFRFTKRPEDPEWQQRIPLMCDWTLSGFPLVAAVHRELLFSGSSRHLPKTESSFLCMQRIISFGVAVARITQVIDYTNQCDADHCLFTLSSLIPGRVSEPVTSKLVNARRGSAK